MQRGDRRVDLRRRADRPVREIRQFEQVRRSDLGLCDEAAQSRRGLGGHVEPAVVAENGIAAVEHVRLCRADARDAIGDDVARRRCAEISGDDGIARPEHAEVGQAVDAALDGASLCDIAAMTAVARVVRKSDGGNRPDVVAETLQREDGNGIADMAVDDVGLDRQNVHARITRDLNSVPPYCTRAATPVCSSDDRSGKHDLVDHVDHAVRLVDVGDRDAGRVAL